MLYQDWDILLTGTKVRITSMEKRDDKAYGRLMFGENYDRLVEILKDEAVTGIEKTLEHRASDEKHAIRPIGDDRFIGWITLQKDEEGRPDIGISLLSEYQNKGIGPEAVALFVNRLYSDYGIQTVYVRISEENIQNQKAFAKLGAIFDKTEPHYIFGSLAKELPENHPDKSSIPNLRFYHIPLPVHYGSSTVARKCDADDHEARIKYLGTVTVYSHLQACGLINDHAKDCPCYQRINDANPTIRKRRYLEK